MCIRDRVSTQSTWGLGLYSLSVPDYYFYVFMDILSGPWYRLNVTTPTTHQALPSRNFTDNTTHNIPTFQCIIITQAQHHYSGFTLFIFLDGFVCVNIKDRELPHHVLSLIV
eukprot:TRINITY_DN2439_c0_g1_i6.p2 TRINITY_DN2439_c0_g1~~TRINITY_DN2439_c0_g1_i6.p2  ORF type:complete len:112 (-),score=8.45 TRINITY_DN2439_c0_g1_i6:106-441(-)